MSEEMNPALDAAHRAGWNVGDRSGTRILTENGWEIDPIAVAAAEKIDQSNHKASASGWLNVILGLAVIVAVIAGIGWFLVTVFSGISEPSSFEKFQPVWNSLTPQQQDAICLNWEVSPNSTEAELATALGYPGTGQALAGQLLNHVC